jgi:hypothetical protein
VVPFPRRYTLCLHRKNVRRPQIFVSNQHAYGNTAIRYGGPYIGIFLPLRT